MGPDPRVPDDHSRRWERTAPGVHGRPQAEYRPRVGSPAETPPWRLVLQRGRASDGDGEVVCGCWHRPCLWWRLWRYLLLGLYYEPNRY